MRDDMDARMEEMTADLTQEAHLEQHWGRFLTDAPAEYLQALLRRSMRRKRHPF